MKYSTVLALAVVLGLSSPIVAGFDTAMAGGLTLSSGIGIGRNPLNGHLQGGGAPDKHCKSGYELVHGKCEKHR